MRGIRGRPGHIEGLGERSTCFHPGGGFSQDKTLRQERK